ncbi:hypothetical protein TNCV_705581 [Trichonephila clavipes]|nr:hypothetical protein TNCV_705581 [Trichonephila clavipes]
MRTCHTQMPLPTTSRWQHLSRKASRRRTAVLSPIRIKRRKTPLPKDLSRQWPNFANFSGLSGHLRCRKGLQKNAKTSEDRLDIFSGVLASEGKKLNTP